MKDFKSELKRFEQEENFTSQRKSLRKARLYLSDLAPMGRRKRLFMAMFHCFLGLLKLTP